MRLARSRLCNLRTSTQELFDSDADGLFSYEEFDSLQAKVFVLGGCLMIEPAVQALYALVRDTGMGASAALPVFAAELLAGGLLVATALAPRQRRGL